MRLNILIIVTVLIVADYVVAYCPCRQNQWGSWISESWANINPPCSRQGRRVRARSNLDSCSNPACVTKQYESTLYCRITSCSTCSTGYSGKCCHIGPYKSCEEALRTNNDKAGYYWLMPNGVSNPVSVRCWRTIDDIIKTALELTTNPFKESVRRDKRQGYNREFVYKNLQTNMQAFINSQSSCRQYVSAKCLQSLFVGTNNVWLKDSKGRKINYWGGAGAAGKGCACGITKTCTYRNQLCNCDANREQVDTDSGYITDKTLLPLSGIYIQDTTGIQGYISYEIGHVECSLTLSTQVQYTSCKEALLMNNGKKQLYDIRPGGTVTFRVFCEQRASEVITLFQHDKLQTLYSHGTSKEFSFSYDVHKGKDYVGNYVVNHGKGKCKQHVRFQCYHSLFVWRYATYLFIHGKNDERIDSLGGTSFLRRCPCSRNYTCVKLFRGCNCDINNSAWNLDEGDITDQSALPVTRISSIDVNDNGEWLVYTVGAVECSDSLSFDVTNHALGKVANHSSQAMSTVTSERALSGIVLFQYQYQGGCSRTGVTDYPWWRIDLSQSFKISKVVLTPRQDYYGTDISGTLQVIIGNDTIWNGTNNSLCVTGKSLPVRKESISFPCTSSITGRYVFVRVNERQKELSLCTVVISDSGGKKISLNPTQTSQSANYQLTLGPPSRAVDGGFQRTFEKAFDGACSLTLSEYSPWWRVDLGKTIVVSLVRITTAINSFTGGKWEIYVGFHMNFTFNSLCNDDVSLSGVSNSTYRCWQPLRGNYVHIRIPLLKVQLTLCEVEVFGTDITVNAEPAVYYSCLDAVLDNNGQDGQYLIYPGYLDQPLSVSCKYENNKVVTGISHNFNQETLQSGFPSKGGHQITIQYHADLQAVRKFVLEQSNCRQYTRAECIGTKFVGKQYSWLMGYNENQLTYWGGGRTGVYGCECDKEFDNRCIDNSLKCNCDTDSSVATFDDGYVTNRSALPLIAVRLGGTGSFYSQQYLNVTIGNLECYTNKPLTYKNCLEALYWERKLPTGSGRYDIHPPFMKGAVDTVCIATNGIIKSSFPPDNVRRTIIKGAEAPGSYERIFRYNGVYQNLLYYIDHAAKCSQFFKYECHNAPFRTEGLFGIPIRWTRLFNRLNQETDYIGSGHLTHQTTHWPCSCFINSTCLSGHVCNCNKLDNQDHVDEGSTTKKSDLPILKLSAGHTNDATDAARRVAYYTLGPVECQFQSPVHKMPHGFMLHVHVRSETNIANSKAMGFSGGKATIEVNGVDFSPAQRGLNWVIVNAATGLVTTTTTIDTSTDSDYLAKLTGFIDSIPDHSIVLVAIQEEGYRAVQATRSLYQNQMIRIKGVFIPLATVTNYMYALIGYMGSHIPHWTVQKQSLSGTSPSDIMETIELQPEIYESCTKALLAKKKTKGYFLLDPTFMNKLVYAYCVYDDRHVITKFRHNDEQETKVEGYPGQYAYQRQFRYALDFDVLKEFVDGHGNCRQFVKHTCNGTVPKYIRVLDRNGDPFPFWGGGNKKSECSCGLTGLCIGDNTAKCNCQSRNQQNASDEGYIMENRRLPITSIQAGNVGKRGEITWHIVKELECYDTKETPGVTDRFCIQHFGGKFLTLASDGYVRLTSQCSSMFSYRQDKTFMLTGTKKCIQPLNLNDNTFFQVKAGCGSLAMFRLTLQGSIQHIGSNKCIHPLGGSRNPPESRRIVIHTGCDAPQVYFKLVKVSNLPRPVVSVSPTQPSPEHENVILSCNGAEDLPVYYVWLKGDDIVQKGTTSNKYTITLTRQNSGSYWCRVVDMKTFHNHSESAPVTLTAQYLDTPSISTDALKPLEIRIGTIISLTCSTSQHAAGVIIYRFYKGNDLARESTSKVYPFKTTKGSSGKYWCSATNMLGPKTSTMIEIRIVYMDLPVIRPSADLTIDENNGFFFHCAVTSVPPPTITIRHNNITIGTTAVQLLKANRIHAGRYTCEAETPFDKLTSSITLQVHYMDNPVLSPTPKGYAKVSSFYTFNCTSNTNMKGIVYEFYRDKTTLLNRSSNGVFVLQVPMQNTLNVYCSTSKNQHVKYSNTLVLETTYFLDFNPLMFSGQKEGENLYIVAANIQANPMPAFTYEERRTGRRGNFIGIIGVLENTQKPPGASDLLIDVHGINPYGTITKRTFPVLIYYIHKVALEVVHPSAYSGGWIKEGQRITVRCTVDSFPTVNIYSYKNSQRRGTHCTSCSQAIILDSMSTTPSDTGIYRCFGYNILYGGISDPLTLQITYLRAPILTGLTTGVREGDPIRMTCKADAAPTATYKWFYVKKANQWNNTVIAMSPELVISKSSRDHSGFYYCNASNPYGVKSSIKYEINVKYMDKPEIRKLSPTEDTKYFNVNTAVTLWCWFHSSFTRITRVMYKDGYQFQGHSEYLISTTSIKRSDAGLYWCSTNDIEMTFLRNSDSMLVQVSYLDTPTVEVKAEGEIKEDDKIEIRCIINSFPAATVEWSKNDAKISSEINSNIVHPNVKRGVAGTYKCCATNYYGTKCSASKLVVIQYLDKPSVNSSSSRTIVEGNTLRLKCKTSSVPVPVYRWTRNGVLIETGKELLVIDNIRRQDAGDYVCHAQNSLGTKVSDPVKVDVHFLDHASHDHNDTRIVMLNSSISLSCNAARNPGGTVKWYFNGTELPQDLITDNILHLKNVSKQSKGNYYCEFNNTAGSRQTSSVYLDVHYITGQQILVSPELTRNEDQPITITCLVDANPQPSYRVIKDGSIIVHQDPVMSILKVKRQQAGNYSCHTYNQGGNRYTGTLTLVVRYLDTPLIDKGTAYKVVEGENVSTRCSAVAFPPATYQWLKDSITTSSSSVQTITNITRAEAGHYHCQAFNAFGNKTSQSVFIDVQYLDTPSISTNVNSTIVESGNLTISCNVTSHPPPKWKWYKNDVLLADTGSTLSLDNIDKGKTGIYHCEASNAASKKSSSKVHVNVLYIHRPVINMLSIYEPENKNITLTCYVDANPSAEYIWKYNGMTILGQSLSSLNLGLISRNQSGNYSCSVFNRVGMHHSNAVHLDVAYVDTPVLIYDPSQEPEESSILSITCKSNHKPQVSYLWFRNDVMLDEEDDTLHIKGIKRHHSYRYRCQVRNLAGSKMSDNSTFKVRYIDRPLLTLSTSTTVRARTVVALQCSASSFPSPSFSWFMNGKKIIGSSAVLMIPAASKSDTGIYSCKVNNSMGSKESNIASLNVIYLDTPIIDGTETANAPEGRPSSIRCKVEGNPTPKITWMLNGEVLQSTGQNLTFAPILRQHKGQYQCRASNSFGVISSTLVDVKVIYMDPPTVFLRDIQNSKYKDSVKEFTELNFRCSKATNAPTKDVSYEWRKGNKVINGQASEFFSINNATRNDSGIYYCATKTQINGMKISSEYNVRIIYSDVPQLSPQFTDYVKENQSVALNCNVHSNLNSLWYIGYKNGKETYQASQSRTIFLSQRVKRSDAGVYICSVNDTYTVKTSGPLTMKVSYLDIPKLIPSTSVSPWERDVFVLLCTVNGFPAPEFTWFKKGGGSAIGSDRRLTLKHVNRSSEGSYYCCARNHFGEKCAEMYTFKVKYLDKPLLTSVFPSPWPKYVGLGSKIGLKCTLQADGGSKSVTSSPVNYTLYRDSIDVASSGDISVPFYNFWITKTTKEDNATFRCSTEQDHTIETSHPFRVAVSYLETVSITILDDNIPEGSRLEIACHTTNAHPDPSFSIYFDTSSSGLTKRLLAKGRMTTIDNVSMAHDGYYFCKASNAAAEKFSPGKKVHVYYMKKPTWTADTPMVVLMYVKEGTKASLKCMDDANYNPVSYIVYKDGEPLANSSTAVNTNSIRRHDAGMYWCTARNKYFSQNSEHYNLVVTYLDKPVIKSSSNTTITETSALKLDCEVVALPMPTYEWYKDGVKIQNTSLLFWPNISKEDKGSYHCCASNYFGRECSDAVTVNIQYLYSPKINASSPHKIAEFSTLVLRCSVDSNPASYFTWFKGEKGIRSMVETLWIYNISRQERGRYCCRASNVVGKGDTTCVNVDVLYLDNPTIADANATRLVREGSSVSLWCAADRNPDGDVVWYFGGRNITSSKLSGLLLQLDHVNKSNHGKYTCEITNSVGTKTTSSVNLIVYYLRDIKISPSTTMVIKESSSLTANCEVTSMPAAQCQWVYRGSSIVSLSSTLHINGIKRMDSGSYQCTCHNILGHIDSNALNVKVHYFDKPRIAEGAKIDVNEAGTVHLRCLVAAYPDATIQWLKKTVIDDLVMPSLGNTSLTSMTNILRKQAGCYRCKAQNSVDMAFSDYTCVNVRYIDESVVIPSSKQTIKEGDSINLSCSGKANPIASITWYRGNVKLPFTMVNLTLSNVNLNMSGEYHCLARNVAGQKVSNRVAVEVQYIKAPAIMASRKGYVKEKSQATLTCDTVSSPPPKITWMKDNIVLSSTLKTLIVNLQSSQETGNYSCIANNTAGQRTSNIVQIIVSFVRTPVLSVSPQSSVIEGTKRVTLTCQSDHVPTGTYSWFKNGQPLTGRSGHQLFLQSVSKVEAGVYKCEVENTVDKRQSNEITFHVQYVYKPVIKLISPASIKEGEKLELRCEVDSSVSVTFSWTKNGVSLLGNNIILTGNQLLIQRSFKSDTGSYICQATADSLSKETRSDPVTIHVKHLSTPTISSSVDTQPWENSYFVMTCNVQSYPEATYMWFKGSTVVSSERNYAFRIIKKSDSGTFYCQASNGDETKRSESKIINVQALTSCNAGTCQNGGTCESNSVNNLCRCSSIRFYGIRCEIERRLVTLTLTVVNILQNNIAMGESQVFAKRDDPQFKVALETTIKPLLQPNNIIMVDGSLEIRPGSILLVFDTYMDAENTGKVADIIKKLENALSSTKNQLNGADGVRLQVKPRTLKATDLDECKSGKHSCSEHATCTNTFGSYTCKCKDGFSGDGQNCESETKVSTAVIMVAAVAGFFLLLLLILIIICIVQTQKTKVMKPNTSDPSNQGIFWKEVRARPPRTTTFMETQAPFPREMGSDNDSVNSIVYKHLELEAQKSKQERRRENAPKMENMYVRRTETGDFVAIKGQSGSNLGRDNPLYREYHE